MLAVGADADPFDRSVRSATSADGGVAASTVVRIRSVRIASLVAVILLTWLWLVRTTGTLSPSTCGLLAGFVLISVALGSFCARMTSRTLRWHPGIAYELLAGFFVCNTLLFVLTLASPLGFGIHAAVLAVLAVIVKWPGRRRQPMPRSRLNSEIGSLACIVFTGLAATLWVQDQQPIVVTKDGATIFTVWLDVFIHAREISAFAQSHGLSSISDIKLSGIAAPAYHFASYMMPAMLNALSPISALDSYAAFQLPFGIMLVGLAGYVLPATVLRTTWPAVIGSAVLIALPDAYQQVSGVRYLSFHFMTQVNLGMLYGIACAAMAWMFMMEACRSQRFEGLLIAYALLVVCLSYKAHLFVANALLLLLYPCVFYGRFRWQWRFLSAIALIVIFVAVVVVSQSFPRVPTLRLDGSGIHDYVDILMGGFRSGPLKSLFDWLYYHHRFPWIVGGAIASGLVILASFGIWTLLAPLVYWRARRLMEPRTLGFVLLILVNYIGMSMLLAMDERGVGSKEEFLNRPHAWAYFVVVVFVTAYAVMSLRGRRLKPTRREPWMATLFAGLLLYSVHLESRNLETFPEWDAHARYEDFNAIPTCLVRSAQYIRDHERKSDVMQDSRFDPRMIVTAIAERQSYVARSAFGGSTDIVAERSSLFQRIQEQGDVQALADWALSNRVKWYLVHPEDTDPWEQHFLQQAVYQCEGFRVFRLRP